MDRRKRQKDHHSSSKMKKVIEREGGAGGSRDDGNMCGVLRAQRTRTKMMAQLFATQEPSINALPNV